jgi:fumarate reductase iron-sulfur subunit
VGTDAGVFGCVGLLACHDYCPKNLPLMEQLAYLRRRVMLGSLRSAISKKERRPEEQEAVH